MYMPIEHLHRGHAALRDAVERLRVTAQTAGTVDAQRLRTLVADDRRFLMDELLPHMVGEEEVLYPAIRDALHSERSTAGMEHDHRQIKAMVRELAEIDEALFSSPPGASLELVERTKRVTYGLYAVIVNHLDKEEIVYEPVLAEALDDSKAEELVTQLERSVAAHQVIHLPVPRATGTVLAIREPAQAPEAGSWMSR